MHSLSSLLLDFSRSMLRYSFLQLLGQDWKMKTIRGCKISMSVSNRLSRVGNFQLTLLHTPRVTRIQKPAHQGTQQTKIRKCLTFSALSVGSSVDHYQTSAAAITRRPPHKQTQNRNPAQRAGAHVSLSRRPRPPAALIDLTEKSAHMSQL